MESAAREAERSGIEFVTGEEQGTVMTLVYEGGGVKGAQTKDGKQHIADRTVLCAGANADGIFDMKQLGHWLISR